MAKDGTNRGGARAGAGRKPKSLAEKIAAGNPGHRPLTMIDSSAMEGVDMPPPSDYLSAMQRVRIWSSSMRFAYQDGCSAKKLSASLALSERTQKRERLCRVRLFR